MSEQTEREACEACLHWKQHTYREPGPEPETHGSFLGVRYRRDVFTVRVEKMIRARDLAHNECGRCHRYPEPVKTHRQYLCGEFAAKDAAP